MNAKTSSLLALSLALSACTAAGAPSPSPIRPPTQPATINPTKQQTSGAASSPSATPSTAPASGTVAVNGRQFVSTSVTDSGSPRPLVQDTTIRLTFQDATLSANAGCNIIGGNYAIEDGKLVFSGASMTEMACEENRMAQDDWLVSVLAAKPSLTFNGDNLVLTADTTIITLVDREVTEPDQALAGPTWMLTSLISGDAVSSIPANVIATLEFANGGSVDVNPGCNQGAGTYSVDGQSITFTDVITTKMACIGRAMQVENAVLDVLAADDLTFTIDAGTLTLKSGDRGLQFSAT